MENIKNMKENLEEFEKTTDFAKLNALSKISLERPLTDNEFNQMMELKKIFETNY